LWHTQNKFAGLIAGARGCDVDKPRNLAKSVTVQ
jgi:glucosamine 6-phosphate synthetase-like amidotransferase/phosphosugar isomerase protein